LEHHAAGLDDGHVALIAAFAFTHAGLGGLLGDGLVREDPYVELARTLHRSRDRDTRGLDLTRGQKARLGRLQSEVAKGDFAATFGLAAHAALHALAEFCSLRL